MPNCQISKFQAEREQSCSHRESRTRLPWTASRKAERGECSTTQMAFLFQNQKSHTLRSTHPFLSRFQDLKSKVILLQRFRVTFIFIYLSIIQSRNLILEQFLKTNLSKKSNYLQVLPGFHRARLNWQRTQHHQSLPFLAP